MADQCYRKMAFILMFVNLIRMGKTHISSSSSEISDDSVQMNRRSNNARLEYEGLPIEFPKRSRRNEIDEPVKYTTKQQTPDNQYGSTTSKPVYPPLNRRFRRIYNPDEMAAIEEFPFMAALLVNNELWCGGAIIDTDKVLTAAHCLQLQYNNRFFREYVKMLNVRVGSTNATAGGELLRVSEIFFHPNYKPQTLEFNFAVLKLHRNLTFGKTDSHIDSIAYSTDKLVPVDNQILFLGWGSVLGISGSGGEVLLQRVQLPVYDIADCQEVYGRTLTGQLVLGQRIASPVNLRPGLIPAGRAAQAADYPAHTDTRDLVTRTNFCAGYITIPKNVCNHDAGGPAILDRALVGILSFSSKRCDQADQPAVFSTVGAVSLWLENLGEKKVQLRNTAIKSPEMATI